MYTDFGLRRVRVTELDGTQALCENHLHSIEEKAETHLTSTPHWNPESNPARVSQLPQEGTGANDLSLSPLGLRRNFLFTAFHRFPPAVRSGCSPAL